MFTNERSSDRVGVSRLVILVSALAAAFLLASIGRATSASAATQTIDLYAVSGSTTIGAQSFTVWGYNGSNATVSNPGGPTIVVNQGDDVTITLHNQLSEDTGLLVQGQGMIPDLTGVASGGTKDYTFTASRPGTYLYEAGLLPNTQHQVAMGLFGALVVRPAPGGTPALDQAYDASTAFNDEAVLVLSEIDPALNNSASPAAFDMRKYAPKFFLINGKAYPNTDAIPTAAGDDVLLRFVNASINYHSMAVDGLQQRVIAYDGSKLDNSHRVVAETYGPGQTTDAIVHIPATATSGSRLAIHDGNLMLHNGNQAGTGGMLTFLTVGSGASQGDVGPAAITTAYNLGTQTLTATFEDPAPSQSNVAAAEYFLDAIGGNGTGTPMTGAFGASSVDVSAAPVVVPAGEHVLYVRAQDANGNWGVVSSVVVNGGDDQGPDTNSPTIVKSPANGTKSVAIHATGDDTSTGNSNIAAAEYFITDPVGTPGANGTGTAMTVNVAAPVASLDATISAAAVNGLTEGAYVVHMHAQDAAGNWGAFVTIELVVDKTAPNASNVAVAPNPNDGTLAFNPDILGTNVVRLTADLADPASGGVNSDLKAAEAFIDTVGADGKGIVVAAVDGVFDSPAEAGYSDIPLATIAQLSNGNHTIYVHAKDAAGNWGPTSTTTLVIDKGTPVVSGLTASPNPNLAKATTPITLTATATTAGSNLTAAQWSIEGGNWTPMTVSGTGPWSLSATINVSSWADGYYTLSVRAQNELGKWGTPATTVVVIGTPPVPFRGVYFSTLGNVAVPGVNGVADNADIYGWDGSAYSRDWNANVHGVLGSANVDAYDRVDATHFYVSFDADTTLGGSLTVQDEDIVYYDNGTWSVFFDGTAAGLTAGGEDIDAASIVGGTVYFSTSGNVNPPGVGGTADDSDIYRWNGGNSFTRVWDATTHGVAGGANVDGMAIDAVNTTTGEVQVAFVSFSGNTSLPGLGTTQDEDVLSYDNGTWAVYFNGTAHGLTSGGEDIDAFDVPAP